jgi:hypothetical protein
MEGNVRQEKYFFFFCKKVRIGNVTAPKHKLIKEKKGAKKRKIGNGSIFPPELIDREKLV